MENPIKNKSFVTPGNFRVLMKHHYSIAEKYFYIILCYLHKKYKNDSGNFLGHDIATQNGIPSFSTFGLSQRICKKARKKLKEDGLIDFKHIYGEKGYRIGTQYTLCDVDLREYAREAHNRILNIGTLNLSTPDNNSLKIGVISP